MEGLLTSLMAHNVARVREMGAKILVTTCPSCHYTWSHLYPQLGGCSRSPAAPGPATLPPSTACWT